MTFHENDHSVSTSIRVLNRLNALCLAWHFFIWLTIVSLSCAVKPLLMISSVMRGCGLVSEGEADAQYIVKGGQNILKQRVSCCFDSQELFQCKFDVFTVAGI